MTAPQIHDLYRRFDPTSTIIRRVTTLARLAPSSLGAREIRGRAATDAMCDDGIALVMGPGADLTRLQGGQLAWNHKDPIGRVTRAYCTAHEVMFEATLPAGAGADVDDILRKAKTGAINAVSMSFKVRKVVPIMPGRPDRGMRAVEWEALEISLCLVGVDPAAKITERARRVRAGATTMQKALTYSQAALDEHNALARHHNEVTDSAARLAEHGGKFRSALRAMSAALSSNDTDGAAECHARCMRSLAGVAREHKAIADRHADAADCLGAMQRYMRSVGEVLGMQDDPGAQVSDGLSDGQTARSDADRRRRQLEALELAGKAHQV